MHETPPAELVELLSRLELASPGRVASVARGVRKLAGGLPGFEMVWVDALAQARILTTFQAAEINAGRGAALEVGPFTLFESLEPLGYATTYRARQRGTNRFVRLFLIPAGQHTGDQFAPQLESLVRRCVTLDLPQVATFDSCGAAGDRLWVACSFAPGKSVAEWIVHHGRFPPAAVLQLARQMVAGLAACEAQRLVHGDISARQTLIQIDRHAGARVQLLGSGLRGVVRPAESYAHADLPPEAYDSVAPERIADGTPPNQASDIYACGALWWQLLAGRPPIPGATALAKMQSCQTARIPDIRPLAPDTPPELADAIQACLALNPHERPASFGDLTKRLGPATRHGQRTLARILTQHSSRRMHLGQADAESTWPRRAATWSVAAAACLLALGVFLWPKVGSRLTAGVAEKVLPAVSISAERPARAAAIRRQSRSASDESAKNLTVVTRPGPLPGSVYEGTDLVLPADQPFTISNLTLAKGQTIRSPVGKRATVRIPAEGWTIEADDVRFDNIDFTADIPPNDGTVSPTPTGLVVLRARRAEFHGCSWQMADRTATSFIAIDWVQPSVAEPESTLVVADLQLSDCLLRGVAAGIRTRSAGSVSIDLANVLHLGPGPVVELQGAPARDESVTLGASHVTVRDATSLVTCRYDELADQPGQIAVHASDCAFMPKSGAGLLTFSGDLSPDALLAKLQWSGQGSVLAQQAPLAIWTSAEGEVRAAAEDDVQVAGLVRSDVGFAGQREDGPEASRIVRWQVPLRSTEPPGISEGRPLPGKVW
jgi:serine/threonine-protein kinase